MSFLWAIRSMMSTSPANTMSSSMSGFSSWPVEGGMLSVTFRVFCSWVSFFSFFAFSLCYFDTSSPNAADDLETGQGQFQVGVFTNEWMDFNGARINDVNFHDPERCLKSKYAVSRNWTDFTFHLPTETDILQHWKSNFPKFTRPLVSATKINACTSCNCLSCLLRCIKRKRMRWAPPAELATGHGFKLVTS